MTPIPSILLASLIASIVYLAAVAGTALVLALRTGGRREMAADDHDVLSESRFTIPVSLIVRLAAPLRVPLERANGTIRALLALNYPELEVIIITEDLAAAEWTTLKAEWRLEARECFYRRSLTTAPVRMMYRSARDARLIVVDKHPGPAADAVNCGVNLARLRYVCGIDPALVFDADALLRAMMAPMRDPSAIVGATSHVETLSNEDARANGSRGTSTMFATLQRLAGLRAIMDSRLFWRQLNTTLSPRDAVTVWRRDAIVQAGGFSVAAADADLDMMVRLQTSPAPGVSGRIVRTAGIFGRIDATTVGEALRRTGRRQRAVLDAVWTLGTRPGTSVPALLRVVETELVTPLVQAWLVVATAAGAISGWLSLRHVVLVVLLLSFGRASLSAAALLLRGSLPDGPDERTARRLLLAAPAEFVIGGAGVACARAASAVESLKSSRRAA
jgi:hypothetical protein